MQDAELTKVIHSLKPREDKDKDIKQVVENAEGLLRKIQEYRKEYEKTLLACNDLYTKADDGLKKSKNHRQAFPLGTSAHQRRAV